MLFNCVFSMFELCVCCLAGFLRSTGKNSIEENGLHSDIRQPGDGLGRTGALVKIPIHSRF